MSTDTIRVKVRPRSSDHLVALPWSDTDWTLRYQFVAPPLPSADSLSTMTVYLWGDVDFDKYGNGKSRQLSHFEYNQVVPQLMAGRKCFSGPPGDPEYGHKGVKLTQWAIQAQYYWKHSNGTSYGQFGPLVEDVDVGSTITSSIAYSAESGALTITIEAETPTGETRRSSFVCDKPFPSSTEFSSWKDFFDQARPKSKSDGGILSTPAMNIEADDADLADLDNLIPWKVLRAEAPGYPWQDSSWEVSAPDGLSDAGAVDPMWDLANGDHVVLSTKFLGADQVLTASGDEVKMKTADGTSAQRWRLVDNDDGTYALKTSENDDQPYLKANARPKLGSEKDRPSRHWRLIPYKGGYYRLSPLSDPDLALDITRNEHHPIMTDWDGKTGQQWKLTKA